MSYLRGKTQKAKKFGTPTTPAVSTPKTLSPKAPKIVRTVAPTVTTAPKAVSKPTTTRRVITPTEAGKIAQKTFTVQVQSQLSELKKTLAGFHPDHYIRQSIEQQIEELEEKIEHEKEVEIAQIETEPVFEEVIEPIIEEVIELPEILPEVIAEPDPTITDNMVTQQVINFNIVNGRAVGSIRFVATNNFNPYYYGHNIVNIIKFKDPNGVNILTFVKENRLNFTETERDEEIFYDEDMQGNIRATVESFVWSSATQPTAFSKMYSIEISEAEPPKPIASGFMSAGVAGAIAGLVLLGFIIDHKVSKR